MKGKQEKSRPVAANKRYVYVTDILSLLNIKTTKQKRKESNLHNVDKHVWTEPLAWQIKADEDANKFRPVKSCLAQNAGWRLYGIR